MCPSNSIKLVGGKGGKAVINTTTCLACGTCVASCPVDAISQRHFTDEQLQAQLNAIDPLSTYPLIVAFLCNWCAYRAADLAGVSRMKYTSSVRSIRVMCVGRIDPSLVLDAFRHGADGVYIGGCILGECHYHSGNYRCNNRMEELKKMLKEAGIEPDRLKTVWLSANEGEKYARTLEEFRRRLLELGPIGKGRPEN